MLAVLLPAIALAVRLWTLSATPMTITAGAATAVTVTITNTGDSSGGDEITCVRIQFPSSFTVTGVSILSIHGSSSGPALAAWTVVGPSSNVLAVKNPDDKYPLVGRTPPLDEAVIRVTGTASTAGVMTWTGEAADKPGGATSTSCGSGTFPPASLAFTVHPAVGPTPAPTPAPTAPPTPAPTTPPTAAPTPTPTAASTTPAPTPGRTATPRPPGSGSTSTPPPSPTPSGDAGPSPSASQAVEATATATPTSTDSTGEAPSPNRSPDPAERTPLPTPARGDAEQSLVLGLGTGSSGAGGGAGGGGGRGSIANLDGALASTLEQLPGGVLAWTYPAVALSVPGLLLIAAVAGQMLGAFAWIPVIRRSLSGVGTRHRRGRKR